MTTQAESTTVHVLGEGGGVEEIVDGFATLDDGETGGAVDHHVLLHGVDSRVLAHVGVGTIAQLR